VVVADLVAILAVRACSAGAASEGCNRPLLTCPSAWRVAAADL